MQRLAVAHEMSGVRLIQAAQNCGQRALTRAVLAEQGVHLARAHVKAHVVVGEDSRESLDDVMRRERTRGHTTVVMWPLRYLVRGVSHVRDQPLGEPMTPLTK